MKLGLPLRFTLPISGGGGGGDVTAPDAINDLSVTAVSSSSATISFTEPGDDGAVGVVAGYVCKYSTSVINAGNFDAATTWGSPPTPTGAGNSAEFTVTGLSQSTTYYFAVKAYDEVPNTSAISNVASDTTSGLDYYYAELSPTTFDAGSYRLGTSDTVLESGRFFTFYDSGVNPLAFGESGNDFAATIAALTTWLDGQTSNGTWTITYTHASNTILFEYYGIGAPQISATDVDQIGIEYTGTSNDFSSPVYLTYSPP